MHFQHTGPIFQVVLHRDHLSGQLPLLAHRHEAGPENVSQRRSEDEAARFDPDDLIDMGALIAIGHRLHGKAQGTGILEQRGDVAEENPRLRIVWNTANVVLQPCRLLEREGALYRSMGGSRTGCDRISHEISPCSGATSDMGFTKRRIKGRKPHALYHVARRTFEVWLFWPL